MLFDFNFSELKGYRFYYYDSSTVREIAVQVNARDLKYLPRKFQKEHIGIPLEIVYPLYLFKKEKISKITWAVYPLSEWIATKREDDSVAALIERELIVEDVLDSLAKLKRK